MFGKILKTISGNYLMYGAIGLLIIGVIIVICVLLLMRRKNNKKIEKEIEELDFEKNTIISSTLVNEITKAEGLLKNEKLSNKLSKWKKEFTNLEERELPKLDEKIKEANTFVNTKAFKEAEKTLSKTELDVFYVKTKAENLLEEIRTVTESEERNRERITKLKSTYREIVFKYNKNKLEYKEVENSIDLQFETIDKLFSAFEMSTTNNDFDEIDKIVKALEDLIHNMQIVVDEAPTVLMLGKMILPKKINDIKTVSKKMIKDGYNLDYLKLDYNTNECEKKLEVIFDKLKVLNLDESIFELKTMADYFDSLYSDFDKEKRSKKEYERSIIGVTEKLSRLSKIIKNVYAELGDLKDTYDLTTDEIAVIDDINKDLTKIKDEFKLVNDRTLTRTNPYSKLANDCEMISVRLLRVEDKLESTLKNLGSLREDEARARDQLTEIKSILKDAKNNIKEYKLPVIPKNFNIELKEAHDAVKEIIVELEKKPISIKTLNTRVDNARDLAFKLNNTAYDTSRAAAMAEMAIVYGNRYKSSYKEIESGIIKSENLFYKGEYKDSLEVILNTLNMVEPGIHKKLMSKYLS